MNHAATFESFESSTLRTRRLRIEPLVIDHAPLLFEGLQDPEPYRYIPQEPPASLDELLLQYSILEARRSPDGTEAWLNWALIGRDDRPHGYAQATVHFGCKEAWIAYFVFVPSQRQGYAGEALRALLPAIRDAYGIAWFHAEIDTRNTASIRLVESLGFERVREVSDVDEFKGGISNEYHYALAGVLP